VNSHAKDGACYRRREFIRACKLETALKNTVQYRSYQRERLDMEKYYQKHWQQRFQNFERTLSLLEEAINISTPSVVERAGMI